MIVSIELKNIGPYSDKVVLDFRANKRDKSYLDSVCVLPDGLMVSKVIGIIAGNAYGKTTILDSLNAIGSFIGNPMFKKKVNSIVETVEEEDFKKFILEYGKFRLIPINKKNNGVGYVAVDMYIDTQDDYSGYYNYSIKYDDNYLENGVIEEKMTFRKKYDSKKVKEIFRVENNLESEIGYKITYKNNIIVDFNPKAKKAFEEKLKYYENFYNRYVQESSTLDAENYIFDEDYIIGMLLSKNSPSKEFLNKFLKLIDLGIIDVELDSEDENNKKLYFVYDGYKLRYNLVSTATKKMCSIALNLFKASRKNGIFTLDEIDNSLNKNIAKFIINLYRKNIVTYTSQIIFTTNNPDMLDNFRRDQIFLIEKNNGINNVIRYSNFVDATTNKKSRSDWSFTKAYDNNIIANYPSGITMECVSNYLNDILVKSEKNNQ